MHRVTVGIITVKLVLRMLSALSSVVVVVVVVVGGGGGGSGGVC